MHLPCFTVDRALRRLIQHLDYSFQTFQLWNPYIYHSIKKNPKNIESQNKCDLMWWKEDVCTCLGLGEGDMNMSVWKDRAASPECCLKITDAGTSLVLQWLRTRLPMQGTQVCSLVRASLVTQAVKNPFAMQEPQVRSLGWEEPLEKEMVIHSSILAWWTPWTEEPGGLQSMGLQRVRHS